MEPQKNDLDFVLHANDVCTPAALQAYAEAANAHGATDVATNVAGLANQVLNFQTTNGSVLPSVETGNQEPPKEETPAPPVDTPPVDTPPVDNGGQQPPVVETPAPPVDQPPVETPPADQPPVEQPAGNQEFLLNDFNAEIKDGKIIVEKKTA